MPNPDGSLTPEEFEQARKAMTGGQPAPQQEQGLTGTATYDPAEWKDGVYVGPQNGGEISLDAFAQAQQVDNADAAIAQLPKNPKAGQDGFMGWVTGNSRQEYDIPEFETGVLGSAATAMAFGDEGKMGIIQKMYADEQPTFTPDKFGNIMVTFGAGDRQGKTFYVNKPGFSSEDATTLGYNAALTMIPGGLAANAARAVGVRGALAVGGSAALGGMAGDTARQITGNALGDQTRAGNVIPGINIPEMVTAGAGEGLGAGVGYAGSTFPRLADAPANVVENVRNAGALSERTGIPFTRGQVVNTPASRTRMSNLSEYPQTSGAMADTMAAQTTAAREAVDQFVNPPSSAPGILADTRAQDAAAKVIQNAKEARKAAADPAYAAALDGKPMPLKEGEMVPGWQEIGREGDARFLVYETPDGQKVNVNLVIGKDGAAEISIDPFLSSAAGAANRFGPSQIRKAGEDLRRLFPEITSFNGERLSGAAPGRLQSVAVGGPKQIDTTPLVSNLENVRKGLTKNDPLRSTLDKAIQDLAADDMWQLSPRQIQSVRIAVNDAREEALRQGKNGLANSLKPVVDDITTFLDNNANGYTAANQLWTDLTKPIEQLERSAIGTLAQSDSFTLAKFTERLFGENSALKAQREFVKQNLDKVDPTIYPDLARAELQRRLSMIPDYGMGGGERNVPMQLNKALFGTETSRDMWKQALPGMEQTIDDLADALDIAARGRAKESGTVAKGAEADAATSAIEKARLRDTTTTGILLSTARWAVTKAAEKAGGPFTNRIRQGQLAQEINADFPKEADKLLEQMRQPNNAADRAIVAFIQSAKQYAASEPDPQDKPKTKQGVLAE